MGQAVPAHAGVSPVADFDSVAGDGRPRPRGGEPSSLDLLESQRQPSPPTRG